VRTHERRTFAPASRPSLSRLDPSKGGRPLQNRRRTDCEPWPRQPHRSVPLASPLSGLPR